MDPVADADAVAELLPPPLEFAVADPDVPVADPAAPVLEPAVLEVLDPAALEAAVVAALVVEGPFDPPLDPVALALLAAALGVPVDSPEAALELTAMPVDPPVPPSPRAQKPSVQLQPVGHGFVCVSQGLPV